MADLETGLGVFLALWGIAYLVGRLKAVREKGIKVKPFFIMYKSDKVEKWLRGIATRTTFWGKFASFSVGLGSVLMVSSVAFLLYNLITLFQRGGEGFAGVTLLIPGLTIVNPQALLYFFLSVPIILLLHEGAHGVVAILEKIKVKSGGVAALATLIAGFVEPDEEEFKKASAKSRLKVLAVGSSANVVFSFLIAALLLIHPFFAVGMPAPIRSTFYGDLSGVQITGLAEGSGAVTAGIRVGDVITHINAVPVTSFGSFNLKPGETVSVGVLRGSQVLLFQVTTKPSPADPTKGVLGITSAYPYYPPKLSLGVTWPTPVMLFLFWLWFLSLNIGLFNMLPFYPLDGDGFFNALIGTKLSESSRHFVRVSVNGFALALLAANLITSFLRGGLITI